MTRDSEPFSDYTNPAREALQQERSEIERECRALRHFQRDIQTLEATAPQGKQPRCLTVQSISPPSTPVFTTIGDCYRETVMGVGHYEAVYGDSLRNSMTAEFGISVVTRLSEADHLTPALKNLVLNRAGLCIERRQIFLEVLEEEDVSLADAHATVSDIEDTLTAVELSPEATVSFSKLGTRYERLDSIAATCESWLQKRQQELHERWSDTSVRDRTDKDLCPYLYESVTVDYPVLATFVEIADAARRRQSRVIRNIQHTP